MTRVVMLSVGSRGDAEPYCAIAQNLLQHFPRTGVKIDLFLQTNLQHLGSPFQDNSSFRLFRFPFSSDDFYKASTGFRVAPNNPHPDPRMKHVENFATIVRELVLPCLAQVLEIVDAALSSQERVVIITSAFTRSLAFLIAHARENVKVILLHLQPLLPNRIFPSYRTSRQAFVRVCLETSTNVADEASGDTSDLCEESYWRIEDALEEFFLKMRSGRVYRECFGTTSEVLNWRTLQNMLTGKHEQVWIVNSYSNHLVPPLAGSPGVGPRVFDIGPVADDYVPTGKENMDPMLRSFLGDDFAIDDRKPLCIGFGSMPCPNVGIILEAIKILKERAVLVGDVFLQIPESHPARRYKRICCVPSVPYPLFLPRCSMMICHGGIGVVQACLRAGVPSIISPLMGDQFALAELVEAKGYGVKCGSKLSDITVEDIVQAVHNGRICATRCQDLARKIREDTSTGPEKMANLVLELLESATRYSEPESTRQSSIHSAQRANAHASEPLSSNTRI